MIKKATKGANSIIKDIVVRLLNYIRNEKKKALEDNTMSLTSRALEEAKGNVETGGNREGIPGRKLGA